MIEKRRYNVYATIRKLCIGVVVFNLIWLVLALALRNKILPNPIDVYRIMPQEFVAGMGRHVMASLWRVLAGIVIALLFGVVGGLATAFSKRLNKILEPLLYLSYPVPKLALLPVVMIVFGIDEASKIVMIVLIVVFQLMISIRDAIRHIPRDNYYVLMSLGATKWQNIRHIIIPATLPSIFSALRVTVGIAVSVLFVTETFGTDKGLGFFTVDAWMRLDYIKMYAGIASISVIGFLLFVAIDIADAVFCRWNRLMSRY